jgi:hypothetical protein
MLVPHDMPTPRGKPIRITTFTKFKIVETYCTEGNVNLNGISYQFMVGLYSIAYLFFSNLIAWSRACLLQKVRSSISFQANSAQAHGCKPSRANASAIYGIIGQITSKASLSLQQNISIYGVCCQTSKLY